MGGSEREGKCKREKRNGNVKITEPAGQAYGTIDAEKEDRYGRHRVVGSYRWDSKLSLRENVALPTVNPFLSCLPLLLRLLYPTKNVPDREIQGEGRGGRDDGSSLLLLEFRSSFCSYSNEGTVFSGGAVAAASATFQPSLLHTAFAFYPFTPWESLTDLLRRTLNRVCASKSPTQWPRCRLYACVANGGGDMVGVN